MEGLEWAKATDGQGYTKVSVNVDFDFSSDQLKETAYSIEDYKCAISCELDNVLQLSSNGTFSGEASFDGSSTSIQVVPALAIYGSKSNSEYSIHISGLTSDAVSAINIYKKDGSSRTPSELASVVVHELFHTLRIEHPFEKTQSIDTELIHVGDNNYISTSNTDENILYNIMNYSLINIDGQNAGTAPMNLLTEGQLKLMVNEISLQQQGVGTIQRGYKEYDNYWSNTPGKDVIKNK